MLKFHQTKARNWMKQHADKHQMDKQFTVGDFRPYNMILFDFVGIHPIFHICLLKKSGGSSFTVIPFPIDLDTPLGHTPIDILGKWFVYRRNSAATQVLVHWANSIL